MSRRHERRIDRASDANPLIFDINDLSVYYGDFRPCETSRCRSASERSPP